MGLIAEKRPKTGVQLVKKGPKADENPEYEKADYWTMKSAIPNAMNVGVENHAKGGYHAALSNARIS